MTDALQREYFEKLERSAADEMARLERVLADHAANPPRPGSPEAYVERLMREDLRAAERVQLAARQARADFQPRVKPEAARALPRLSQSTLSIFLQSATRVGRGGVTPAGRALQKHAARKGSWFAGRAFAGDAVRNARAGEAIVRDILERGNVNAYTHQVFGDVVDIVIPGGPGARFSAAGNFIGFLEPR